jgi:bla regulator protein BlaR1
MTPASLSPIWAGEVRELCNHLWQSTLFLGIVALLALLMRKNQARIRYWLWMAASAKFLIPFSLLISLGSHLPSPSHAVAPKTTAYVAIEEVASHSWRRRPSTHQLPLPLRGRKFPTFRLVSSRPCSRRSG